MFDVVLIKTILQTNANGKNIKLNGNYGISYLVNFLSR